MKLINDMVLHDSYDVIVVGAGLSGMTAASLLARCGLSVSMIDQRNKPGGACTSIKRVDHVFDGGAANVILREMHLPERDSRKFPKQYSSINTIARNYEAWLGAGWRDSVDQRTGQVGNLPKVFISKEFNLNDVIVVEAVASGRKVACSIDQFLN